jgi:formiminotetrahydrofolate cyclodeaminase
MDPLLLLWIGGAGAAGALCGAGACHWLMSRRFAALRDRVERAEQARNGAIERSAKAREQIAQLNKAIDELRRIHRTPSVQHRNTDSAKRRREAAERALDAAGGTPSPEALRAFADTQVLNDQ